MNLVSLCADLYLTSVNISRRFCMSHSWCFLSIPSTFRPRAAGPATEPVMSRWQFAATFTVAVAPGGRTADFCIVSPWKTAVFSRELVSASTATNVDACFCLENGLFSGDA